MMKRIPIYVACLLLTACSSGVVAGNNAGSPIAQPSQSIQSSKKFPDVALMDLETSKIKRSNSLLGSDRIYTFWASWCQTCASEFPLWRDKELSKYIIGINVQDASAGKSFQLNAKKLMTEQGISFPNFIDIQDQLTTALGIVGLPVTIVVDSEGNIVRRQDGAITRQQLIQFNQQIHR